MMCVQTDVSSNTVTETEEKTLQYFLEGVMCEWDRVWWGHLAHESARLYVQLNCLALKPGL